MTIDLKKEYIFPGLTLSLLFIPFFYWAKVFLFPMLISLFVVGIIFALVLLISGVNFYLRKQPIFSFSLTIQQIFVLLVLGVAIALIPSGIVIFQANSRQQDLISQLSLNIEREEQYITRDLGYKVEDQPRIVTYYTIVNPSEVDIVQKKLESQFKAENGWVSVPLNSHDLPAEYMLEQETPFDLYYVCYSKIPNGNSQRESVRIIVEKKQLVTILFYRINSLCPIENT